MVTVLSSDNFIVKFIINSIGKTKEVITVKVVWLCDPKIIKFGGLAFALNFSRNY